MKLTTIDELSIILLPDDLLWEDEFKWMPYEVASEYSASGDAHIVEIFDRALGRPITMKSPDSEMAWVTRSTVTTLRTWAAIAGTTYKLVFEYGSDTRTFNVLILSFEATPVLGFPSHEQDQYFTIDIKMIEVE